jgi:hypothetical protein
MCADVGSSIWCLGSSEPNGGKTTPLLFVPSLRSSDLATEPRCHIAAFPAPLSRHARHSVISPLKRVSS